MAGPETKPVVQSPLVPLSLLKIQSTEYGVTTIGASTRAGLAALYAMLM